MRVAGTVRLAGAGALLAVASGASAQAFDLERMATCRDSWLEWSTQDPARFSRATRDFHLAYAPDAATGAFKPKRPTTLFGFPVVAVEPESVGMMVGFSVQIEAPFDAVRPAFEKALGKTCRIDREADGTQGCEVKVRAEGTALLAGVDKKQSLLACAYKYEK